MFKKISPVWWLLGMSFFVTSIVLNIVATWVFPFTADSIIHISTAENITRYGTLVFNNIFLDPPNLDVLPTHLAPPGYPVTIALLIWLGIHPYTAALLIPCVALSLLPFLFFMLYRRFSSQQVALWSTAASIGTFYFIGSAAIAWTDVPYLMFALMALNVMCHIIEHKGDVSAIIYVFLGFLLGICFLYRFVGMSLCFAVALTALYLACQRYFTLKNFIKAMIGVGIGFGLLVVPYLLRNLIVFGSFSVAPASVPFPAYLENMMLVIQYYLQGLSALLFGSSALFGLIPIVMALCGMFFMETLKGREKGVAPHRYYGMLLLWVYFAVYSLFVINAKSQNLIRGNPDIDERLLMQIAWIIIFFLVAAVKDFKRPILMVLVALFLMVQLKNANAFYEQQIHVKQLAKRIQQYFQTDLPQDIVIVSNVPEIAGYYAKRNARALTGYSPQYVLSSLSPYHKYIVFIAKDAGRYSPAWKYNPLWLINPYGHVSFYADKHVEFFYPQSLKK